MGGIVCKSTCERETSHNTEMNSSVLDFEDSNEEDDQTIISILPRAQESHGVRLRRKSSVAFDEKPHIISRCGPQDSSAPDNRLDSLVRRSSEEQLSARSNGTQNRLKTKLVPLPPHIVRAFITMSDNTYIS